MRHWSVNELLNLDYIKVREQNPESILDHEELLVSKVCIELLRSILKHRNKFSLNFLCQSINVQTEMEKRADNADISVLFFGGCANFLAVYAQTN